MSNPLVSGPKSSVYSDYWRTAPSTTTDEMLDRRTVKVFSARDVDEEAGFEPFLEAVFATREEADAYVAQWSGVYSDRQFFVG